MQRIAKTTDEFIEHWGQKQNFLIAPECIGFDMDFPPVEEVIDLLRCDPAVKVRCAEELSSDGESNFGEWVRTVPLEQGGFGISHFDLDNFYAPEQFLHQCRIR